MIIQSAWQVSFDFLGAKPVVIETQRAALSSDAGLLPIRQLDEQLGLTRQFAEALDDLRDPDQIEHTVAEMSRMRIYGILADYADQNDHDVLRKDPVFKLLAGRSPEDDDLASQPTLSRFENMIDIPSLWRLRDVLIDQFIASFVTPPRHLTFDIDVFDDPTHGQQQLTFFHGYYDQYQYLPRAITCAENDLVVMVGLLHGTAHPALGIEDDLTYLVQRLRAVWPDVRILVRGDSGFAVPKTYGLCEELRLDYTLGLGMNAVLKRHSDHRFLANYFRLYLHSAAANLLVRLRRAVANPPPVPAPEGLPAEALAGKQRRDYFNRRREWDPLGEGHPCTWRTRLIKVAAEIVVRSRRILVRLSACWPYLDHYRQVAQAVTGLQATPSLKPG